LLTSVSVIHLDPRLAHGALRQSRKGKSYEDLDDTFTTALFEFFTAREAALVAAREAPLRPSLPKTLDPNIEFLHTP